MDCINKILAGDTSLKGLFKKNEKRLATLKMTLEILKRPVADMPVDPRGYYGRGFYFVAGNDGKMIGYESHSFFHPICVDPGTFEGIQDKTLDMRGVPGKGAWEPYTAANWELKCRHSIEVDIPKIESDIAKIESFLARIVAKGLATPSAK